MEQTSFYIYKNYIHNKCGGSFTFLHDNLILNFHSTIVIWLSRKYLCLNSCESITRKSRRRIHSSTAISIKLRTIRYSHSSQRKQERLWGGEKEEKIRDWISYTYKNDLIGPPAWRQWHLHPRADKRETTDSRDTSAESAHRPRSGPLWWACTAAGSLVSQRHKWEVRLNREWRMVHARPLPRKNSLSLFFCILRAPERRGNGRNMEGSRIRMNTLKTREQRAVEGDSGAGQRVGRR